MILLCLELEFIKRILQSLLILLRTSRGLSMKHLRICPKCHANLKLHSDGETQYCNICKYWTKVGTARLDSIMIYG